MGQINLPRPVDGSSNWAPVADALLDALRTESNSQDTRISSAEGSIVQINTTLSTLSNNNSGGLPDQYVRADDPQFGMPAGTADCAPALTAAMNAAQAAQRDLILPNRFMRILSPLPAWSLAKGSIIGAGSLCAINGSTLTTGPALTISGSNGDGNLIHHSQINRLANFMLSGPTTSATTVDGILFADSSAVDMGSVEHVIIDGFRDSIVFGSNVWTIGFNKVGVQHHQRSAVHFPTGTTNSGENMTFTNCAFYNGGASSTASIYSQGSWNAQFFGCSFDYCPTDVRIEQGQLTFTGCHFENNNTTGAMVEVIVSGNLPVAAEFFGSKFLAQETSGSRGVVETLTGCGPNAIVNFFGGQFWQKSTTAVLFRNSSTNTITPGKFGVKYIVNAASLHDA